MSRRTSTVAVADLPTNLCKHNEDVSIGDYREGKKACLMRVRFGCPREGVTFCQANSGTRHLQGDLERLHSTNDTPRQLQYQVIGLALLENAIP